MSTDATSEHFGSKIIAFYGESSAGKTVFLTGLLLNGGRIAKSDYFIMPKPGETSAFFTKSQKAMLKKGPKIPSTGQSKQYEFDLCYGSKDKNIMTVCIDDYKGEITGEDYTSKEGKRTFDLAEQADGFAFIISADMLRIEEIDSSDIQEDNPEIELSRSILGIGSFETYLRKRIERHQEETEDTPRDVYRKVFKPFPVAIIITQMDRIQHETTIKNKIIDLIKVMFPMPFSSEFFTTMVFLTKIGNETNGAPMPEKTEDWHYKIIRPENIQEPISFLVYQIINTEFGVRDHEDDKAIERYNEKERSFFGSITKDIDDLIGTEMHESYMESVQNSKNYYRERYSRASNAKEKLKDETLKGWTIYHAGQSSVIGS